jgi:hypothetical protein
MKQNIWITIMTIGLTVPAAAQTDGRGTAAPDDARRALMQMVGKVRSRIAVEARITPGRPYSGEAVTESTQVLADGNRIVQKGVTRIYRDGDGRTRRDQINDSGLVESVSIVDPVAHTSFVLQPETRTAYREPRPVMVPALKIVEPEGIRPRGLEMMERAKVDRAKAETGKLREHDIVLPRSAAPPAGGRGGLGRAAPGETVREELGTQNVEGVSATGTRTTTTIPAGAIGNLQPIKVVSEQWFSPDLQVLVLTKHSDPRSGETTYRLVNIVRAEPDRSLFTVPPDYTIEGAGIREPLK